MNWDSYFSVICEAVARKSPCLSRKIGAILARDNSIVSTGYNGPPRNIPHCKGDICPRKEAGYKSGEGMHLCPAQHAEENAVSNAARIGASTVGSTLYMNSLIPCGKCLGTLINAGIIEIVVSLPLYYDDLSRLLSENSNIKIRGFYYE